MHEEEERDFNPQSDLQNAYSHSCQEFAYEQGIAKKAIDELRHMGRWVVVCRGPAYCPSTDAILGERTVMIGDFPDANQAETEASGHQDDEGEYIVEVLPPLPQSLPKQATLPCDDDIPF